MVVDNYWHNINFHSVTLPTSFACMVALGLKSSYVSVSAVQSASSNPAEIRAQLPHIADITYGFVHPCPMLVVSTSNLLTHALEMDTQVHLQPFDSSVA